MINCIEYFVGEHHYNILSSVTNLKSVEYVCLDNYYLKIKLPENPFVLRCGASKNFLRSNRKVSFLFPLGSPVSNYRLLSFDEYKQCRASGTAVGYLEINSSDRLRFSSWVRAERNLRYDVYSYEDLSLFAKRCEFQKKTYTKHKNLKVT
tara:strand:+ start:3889 stop:4338 length:450 start_codon:yes stop_codon:yes gene_type:complete